MCHSIQPQPYSLLLQHQIIILSGEIFVDAECEMKFAHICGANISQRSYFTCPKGKFH